jgi:hypothetical protein
MVMFILKYFTQSAPNHLPYNINIIHKWFIPCWWWSKWVDKNKAIAIESNVIHHSKAQLAQIIKSYLQKWWMGWSHIIHHLWCTFKCIQPLDNAFTFVR